MDVDELCKEKCYYGECGGPANRSDPCGGCCRCMGGCLLAHENQMVMSVIDATHLERQREWSRRTFGPGSRTNGVIDHIRKELHEIQANPLDLYEWVDVIILALDGAWRAGAEPQEIIDAIKTKQLRNELRTWPDWRTLSEHQAIEHDRNL